MIIRALVVCAVTFLLCAACGGGGPAPEPLATVTIVNETGNTLSDFRFTAWGEPTPEGDRLRLYSRVNTAPGESFKVRVRSGFYSILATDRQGFALIVGPLEVADGDTVTLR